MKRIDRLLSLAMASALLLGATPFDAATGARAFSEEILDAQESDGEKSETPSEAEEEKTSKSKKSSKDSKKSSDKSKKSSDKKDSSSKEVRLTLSISKPSGLSTSGGAYQVNPDKVSSLTLSWKCKGDCDSYEVSVSDGVLSTSTEKKSVKISVSGLAEGKYTATVKAIRDGKTVAKEKLSFKVVASRDEAEEKASGKESPSGETKEAEAEKPAEETVDAEKESEAEKTPEEMVEETKETETEESAEQPMENEADKPVETPKENPEDKPAEESAETKADKPVEEAGETPEDKPVGESEEAPKETSEAVAEASASESQQAQAEEAIEEAQENCEDHLNNAQDTPVEQPVGILEDEPIEATQKDSVEPPAEEPQDIPEAQPDSGTEAVEAQASEAAEAAGETTEDALVIESEAESEADAAEAVEELTGDELALDADLDDIPASEPTTNENSQASAETPLASNAQDKQVKADSALSLSIKGAQGLSVAGGKVHVDPAQADALTLVWQFSGKCDGYEVSLSDGVYTATAKDKRLSLPVSELAAGQYSVIVTAVKDGKALSSAETRFYVDAGEGSEAADTGLAMTVAAPQGLLITDGVYQVDPAKVEALTLAWQFGGECDGYEISVSGGVYSGSTGENTLSLPLKGLNAGAYTVSVTAKKDDEAVAQAQLALAVAGEEKKQEEQQGDDKKQGEQQKGGTAPKGGGSAKSGGASKGGEEAEADQGFHVTPGEALISTHTSGDRDMRLYGAVALTLEGDEPMTLLTLGGTQLDIRLSDGCPFTASIGEGALILVPEGPAEAWLLNGFALKTLACSGVETLRLSLNDAIIDFPTQPTLTGSNYGALRAAGWVSGDYSYAVSADGCTVTVGGRTFVLTGKGELA